MGPDVYTADEQGDHPVAVEQWSDLARSVLEAEGADDDAEVSLLFVDEPAMTSLNGRFLGKEGPTDVLAFPIDDSGARGGRSPDVGGTGPGPEDEDADTIVMLGDVVICPAVAARNATDHGSSLEDEMALLVVHGLLHLMGMDHEEGEEAERMERREQQLLARYHHPSP